MPDEAQEEKSSTRLLKRTNDRKVLFILYLSTMAASSLAVSVQAMDETKNGFTSVVQDMLLGTLYATSSLLLFGITVYFLVRRNQTFEVARDSTEEVSFVVKYSSHGEPINLYLRIGLAIFALMSVGQSSVRIAQIANRATARWPEIYRIAFELTFYVFQTTFILIFHRIVILESQELFGASFIHILGTNLCMWADVTVEKIQSTLHLYGSLSSNRSRDGNYSADHDENSQASHISFYLLPAVSEYCLLSAALIYEIIKRIGEPSFIELKEGEGHPRPSLKSIAKHLMTKIKSGYWAPLVIISVIVVLTIITGVTPKNTMSYWKCAVLFTEEILLDCMGIFVTLAAFFKLRHLKFTIPLRSKNIDELQLYIAFVFTVIYLVATVALASYLLRDLDFSYKIQDLLMGRLALDLIELLEVLLQTYLIQDCFRRCSEEEFQRTSKPGRPMIAILLGINLASWVVKSFQVKEADILYSLTDNAPYAWVLIAIAMPVYLFYRYHCTVCLSEAFTTVYEDETSRFESLLRQNPVYLAKLLSHPNMVSSRDPYLCANENADEFPPLSPNQTAQRKFAVTNFRARNAFGRHASFFHPQAMSLRKFSSLSFADSQLMHAEPHFNRFSQTDLHEPRSRTWLPDSESTEGPYYFLNKERRTNYSPHHNVPVPYHNTIEGTIQTDLGAHEIAQSQNPRSLWHSTHRLNHYSHYRPSHSQPLQLAASQVPPTPANQTEHTSDNIPRRTTLVNLQTAKDRVRAMETAHKRVLENANSGYIASSNGSGSNHQATRRAGASPKVVTAGQDALVSQMDAPQPKQQPPKSTVETPESQLPISAGRPTVGNEHRPQASTSQEVTAPEAQTRPITPLQPLEPSKVLHLVMASKLP